MNKLDKINFMELSSEIFKKIKNIRNLLLDISDERNIKKINILVFHHFDLDGLGCKLITKLLFKFSPLANVKYIEKQVRVEYQEIEKYIDNYDYIIIMDLSFSDKYSDKELKKLEDSNKLILLDHHSQKNALRLNNYNFAFVKPQDLNKDLPYCGTVLAYAAFIPQLIQIQIILSPHELCNTDNQTKGLLNFVLYTAYYDTYYFKKFENSNDKNELLVYNMCDALNLLAKNKDGESFVNDMMNNILKRRFLFSYADNNIIINSNIERNNEIESAISKGKEITLGKYKVFLIMYDGGYSSEIGNKVCSDNNIDYCLMISEKDMKCGLRASKDNINLLDIIKDIPGSGGHNHAAGFRYINMNGLYKWLDK